MKRFTNILFFADGAKSADKALFRAIELARMNGARLTVMDIVTHVSTNDVAVRASISSLQKVIVEHREAKLEKLVEEALQGETNLDVGVRVIPGKDAELINHIVKEGYDLVVKAPNNKIGPLIFGLTDFRLLRKCPCPVWLVRHTRLKNFRKILAAVDPNPENEAEDKLNRDIMDLATSVAEMENGELHVVHAWNMNFDVTIARRAEVLEAELSEDEDEREFEKRKRKRQEMNLDKLANAFPDAKFKTHLIKGDPATVIPRFVKDNDINLVVMGTVARTGVPGFFIGNTAEEILHAIKCSVLAIKPEGFVSNLQ